MRALMRGSLTDAEARFWLEQDYLYLLDETRVLARLAWQAPAAHHADLIDLAWTVIHEELPKHIAMCQRFGADLEAHVDRYGEKATKPVLIAELKDIRDGEAIFDEHHRQKQPDWSFGPDYSGKVPAERFGDHRTALPLDDA